MAPEAQTEMLRLGEQILKHYREERSTLLGDAPLPAGVDEQQLEVALLRLQKLEREGALRYDRNTPSWKEFRRRRRRRSEASARASDRAL